MGIIIIERIHNTSVSAYVYNVNLLIIFIISKKVIINMKYNR